MNTEETTVRLRKALDGIIEDYDIMVNILNRSADRETVERFAESNGIDLEDHGVYEEDLAGLADDDGGTRHDEVCGNLEGAAMEAMHDYPLSIDDSHIWFSLGGPNISANVTGWSIDNSGTFPSVDVTDIILKGRWGGASVDVHVWQSDALFDQVAEMFAHNLLMKFDRF